MASIFVSCVCAFGLYVVIEARCYRNPVPAPKDQRNVMPLHHNGGKPNVINYAKTNQLLVRENRNGPYRINTLYDRPGVLPRVAYQRSRDMMVPDLRQANSKEPDGGGTIGSDARRVLKQETQAEAVEEDFDLLLQKMKVDKTRVTTMRTTSAPVNLLDIVDESQVRAALKDDPLVRRLLLQAIAKRQAFFEQMEQNEIVAYDSYQRRYPVYKGPNKN